MRFTTTLLGGLLLCLSAGCTKDIPNTTVEDTHANRKVINFVEVYRRAVETRDVPALLAMAHSQYLDDNGTPVGSDDIDIDALEEKLSRWGERVKDARYEIKYRRVSSKRDKIMVEYRYTASFELAHINGEEKWARRVGDHRIVLVSDESNDSFLILSGM